MRPTSWRPDSTESERLHSARRPKATRTRNPYEAGKEVYTVQCLACHGPDLGGVAGTGGAALIGGRGTLASRKPKKTVESYRPYAGTA